MGKHFPAMTLVEVSKLVDPNAKVEIEAMALLP
jgi:enamine deaminase RidA (YjgF/YER057c/UK114 family)